MPRENIVDGLTQMFLALSDGTRLRLLALMADGEVSVGYLAEHLGESQPKTSRHLAYLRNSGLVSTRRDGKRIYYGIDWPSDASLSNVLGLTLAALPADGEPVRRNKSTSIFKEPTQPTKPAAAPDQPDSSSDLEIFLL